MAHTFKISDLSTPQVYPLSSDVGTLTVTDAGNERANFMVAMAPGKFVKRYTLVVNKTGKVQEKNPYVNQFTDIFPLKTTGSNAVTLSVEYCGLDFYGNEKAGTEKTVTLE